MKKILYSPWAKASAIVLILALVFAGLYKLPQTLNRYYELDEVGYSDGELGESISKTFNYIFDELNLETHCLNYERYPYYSSGQNVYEPFSRTPSDIVEYFAVCGDRVISNMSEERQADMKNMISYRYGSDYDYYLKNNGVILENNSGTLYISHHYEEGFYFETVDSTSYVICINPTESYMSEFTAKKAENDAAYEILHNELERKLIDELIFAAIAVLLIIYLCVVCGKHEDDDEIHLMLIDRMYAEIHALIGLISSIILGLIMLYSLEESFYGNGFFKIVLCTSGTALTALLLTILLSYIRNLKNHTFAKHSLIISLIMWIYRKCKGSLSSARQALSARVGILAAGIVVLFGFLMILFSQSTLICLVIIAAAAVYTLKKLNAFSELQKGIGELGKGNTNYKIKTTDSGAIGDLCREVDNLGDGMTAAVEKQLAAERMKTQLITNVSHDLKTPLTAIINYTELLKDMELEPSEANDYVKIIENKSLRLKALTADLFDISKVQSGNEPINLEELDISLLINQSLGEFDEEIKKSGLDFNVNLEENCIIKGDGAKLSRVFENLLVNTLKYSLSGTRVYINAAKSDAGVTVEIKNISAFPLDFDAEEICDRFVRGDTSRSTEGNGLGLAIAKSYTEAMGGKFKVVTDGDLFKAVLLF